MANGKLITGRGGTPHLSHREQDAYYAALRGDLRLVDSDALTAKLGISSDYARRILHKLYRKGALDWLAKGQYAVVPPDVLFERRQRGVDPRPLLHALLERMGLAEGYYVAYQSAAQMHDAVHQVPFVFQVALTRQHRPLRS
jgi:predicted transcriptional regulator of viral defense system